MYQEHYRMGQNWHRQHSAIRVQRNCLDVITLTHMGDEVGAERKGVAGPAHEASRALQSMVGFVFKDKKAVPGREAKYQAVPEAQILGLIAKLVLTEQKHKNRRNRETVPTI